MKHLIFIFTFAPLVYFAQAYKTVNNANPYKLMFGMGWSIWDNDGNPSGIADFDGMQAEVFPSRIFADYYFYKGWSAEASLAFVLYNGKKYLNQQANISGLSLSSDVNLKYSFFSLLGKGLVDPYLIAGVGGTLHPSSDTLSPSFFPTLNLGAGINFWFNNAVGLQLQSAGKIGLTSDFFGKADYLQHSIGLVVRLETVGGSKEGEFKKVKLKLDTKKKRIKTPRSKGGRKKGKGDDA